MTIKTNISKNGFKAFCKKCTFFWLRHQTVIFSILLFVSVGAGGYVWFQSMYRSSWSDEKKDEFLKAQDTGVKLREEEMTQVLEKIEKRNKSNSSQLDPERDIFVK